MSGGASSDEADGGSRRPSQAPVRPRPVTAPDQQDERWTLDERGVWRERPGITGSGTIAGFGLLASAGRFDTDGPVRNGDYRNEHILLSVSRVFR